MPISFRHRGNFNNAEKFLKKSFGRKYEDILKKYGEKGVEALEMTTPIDTGLTAISWSYEIQKTESGYSIIWNNDNIKDNGKYKINIAVILQYGHATRNGGWVEGRDYINPALQPIFDELAEAAWKEVTSL